MPKNPVDIHVGSRLRLRRTLAGLSQEKLGEAVGLTFQQIQKYEKGANRIGASRLYQFAGVLDVPPSFFFEGFSNPADGAAAATGGVNFSLNEPSRGLNAQGWPSALTPHAPGAGTTGGTGAGIRPENVAGGVAREAGDLAGAPATTREALEMMRAYNSIRDGAIRRRIFDLIKSVAEQSAIAGG